MPEFTVFASFLIKASDRDEAVTTAQVLIDQGVEAVDGNGAIVAAGVETPDSNTVWVASWDMRNVGAGVDLFRSQAAAVESIVRDIDDATLTRLESTQEQIRERLTKHGYLDLDRDGDGYAVSQQPILG